jgi:ADP-ribose pyrophosphatase YjhB (NUDIX family)
MSQEQFENSSQPGFDLHNFPGVHMAVDVAVMTVGLPNHDGRRELMTLLVRRPSGFEEGKWVLPGRFVRFRETLRQAAIATLEMKAGIFKITPRQLIVNDDPDRDPRGWTMAVGHVAPVPFDVAMKAVYEDPKFRDLVVVSEGKIEFKGDQQVLPMDQQRVVDAAVDYLRGRYDRAPDPKGFLGSRFTLSELYEVHAAVLGENYWSRDAMRRNFESLLEPTGEYSSGSVGKPAMIYRRARVMPSSAKTLPRRIQRPSKSTITKPEV